MHGDTGVDSTEYRRVLSHFPTGVVLVTAVHDGVPVGLAVNSFTAVSLRPPLIGFFPAHRSGSWPLIRRAGAFCANILTAEQEPLARLFATPGAERFAGISWRPAKDSGAPILDGVAAWVDCTVDAVTPAGDHDFVLGRVVALGAEGESDPLIFYRSRYRRL